VYFMISLKAEGSPSPKRFMASKRPAFSSSVNPLKSESSPGFVEDAGDKGVPAGAGVVAAGGVVATDGVVAAGGVITADGAVALDGVVAAEGIVAADGVVAAGGVVWASSNNWSPALPSAGCESNEKAVFAVIARIIHASEQKMMRRLIFPPS
jgi:hypothetical protein